MTYAERHKEEPAYCSKWAAEGKTVFYTGDSCFFEELADYCQGCDVLIADCSCAEEELMNDRHMNAGKCGRIAAAAGVGELVLAHIS